MGRAIGGAQGVGGPPLTGGSMLTGARRSLARPNTPTLLGGASGGGGSRVPVNQRPTAPGVKAY